MVERERLKGKIVDQEPLGRGIDLDFDRTAELRKTYDVLSHLLTEEDGDPNLVYEKYGLGLLEIMRDASPSVLEALIKSQEELEIGKGFVVMTGTQIDTLDPELAQLAAITLSMPFGNPTKTDQRKAQIAWPIRFDPNAEGQKTFSQTMGEAAYHTDTQYFDRPERYFGLFCVTSDEVGQGTNMLVDGRRVMEDLARWQPRLGAALREEYPFRVPTVFTKSARPDDVEVVWAPVVTNDGNIRYRKDTLEEALALPGITISETQIEALGAFEEALSKTTPMIHHLEKGEAIIVNNHRLLHARTPYNNPERLLYRVRMDAGDHNA